MRWERWLVRGALALAGGLVLYALGSGSARRHYDVDEIQHTHVTWRIASGDRPFHDFVESHPPFVWYLAAPVIRHIDHPVSAVRFFRGLAALAGLVFVGLVISCACVRQPAVSAEWAAAGALLALSSRANLDYFLEIRPDSTAYALLFGGVLLFLLERPRPLFARYAVFAFLAATSVLWNPKLALLVVLFALAELVLHRRREKAQLASACAGHAVGIAFAAAVAVGVLWVRGVDPLLAYELSIGFHGRFLAATSFSHGLWRRALEAPLLLGAALAGWSCWVALAVTGRARPRPLEIAVLGSSIAALFFVHLPYKQYFAPWFLLTLTSSVPFLGAALRAFSPRGARVALLGVAAFAAAGAWTTARQYREHNQTSFFHGIWETMRDAADPDGRVIADPQWHPIFRKDVFYGWFSTFDPGGRNQDVILSEWNPMGYGPRFTLEGYRRELEQHRPALIVTVGDGFNLPRAQEQALREYLAAKREDYLRVPLAGKIALLVHVADANRRLLESSGVLGR